MKFVKLEFIRASASIYVLFHHLALLNIRELPSAAIKIFLFGPEAVTAFFLLSGFVINYSYTQKSDPFSVYFIKRFRRIYPIYLLSILLSICLLYVLVGNLNEVSLTQIIGHLCMLQNEASMFPGTWISCISNNTPLWSLSREWWYYLLFIPTIYVANKLPVKPFVFATLVSALATILYYLYPNFICLVLMYYILWYAGAEIGTVYLNDKSITLKNTRHILTALFVIICIHTYFIYSAFNQHPDTTFSFMKYPLLTIRYPLAAVAFLLSVIWLNNGFTKFMTLIPEKIIAWTASISYGIYIFHYPILLLPNYTGILLLDIIWKLILVVLVSYVAEIFLQPYFNKLLPVPKKVSNAPLHTQ